MTTEQPEALRLADELKVAWLVYGREEFREADTELRRLHEVLQTIIAIASYGGLADMSEDDAIRAIRRVTRPSHINEVINEVRKNT